MSVNSVSTNLGTHASVIQESFIDWKKYDMEKRIFKSDFHESIDFTLLYNSPLGASSSSKAGEWENRKLFITYILLDILTNCPKGEPLVLISLGSDRLLMEYILGRELIERGFQVSFLLVDPAYRFSSEENKNALTEVLKEFREKINTIHNEIYSQPLDDSKIKYLSRSQNISKYFQDNANTVVIEGLPPYAAVLKDMEDFKVTVKEPINTWGGSGHLVPSNSANSVAFVPLQYILTMKQSGALLKVDLPLLILKSKNEHFYIDWGCKIQTDGTYRLNFKGSEDFFISINFKLETKVKIASGKEYRAHELLPTIENEIKEYLDQNIKKLLNNHNQKQLSQENISELLIGSSEIFSKYFPIIQPFFLADYSIDRLEAIEYLKSHAGHKYRKIFSLQVDFKAEFKITQEEIR